MILLDTSGLLCLLHKAEPQHAAACDAYRAAARRLPRPAALAFVADVAADPSVEVVWGDAGLHGRAIDLLVARPDKSYSLCDAVSFVLMRDRAVWDALTTDHHFEQEGFRRLLD